MPVTNTENSGTGQVVEKRSLSLTYGTPPPDKLTNWGREEGVIRAAWARCGSPPRAPEVWGVFRGN